MSDFPTKEPLFAIEYGELQQMAKMPSALRALADWHDTQETQADAMGMNSSADYHRARRVLLNREADRIDKEWENG